MKYMTYKEWNTSGYNIKKGSKACFLEAGEAVFSQEQVEVKRSKYSKQTHSESAYTQVTPSGHREYNEYSGDCSCALCKREEYDSRHDPESISYTYTNKFGDS